MRNSDIEYWALRILERVRNRQPVEDSRVELKSSWIPDDKAARRIAGHANAARGEPILWLIGVDEKVGAVGAEYLDFATWSTKVSSRFEGLAPRFHELSIPFEGKSIVAIMFETDRAPYVVRNSSGDYIQYETPWREGTLIRSAKREDLLRILVPMRRRPKIEILSGELGLRYYPNKDEWFWRLDLALYVASMIDVAIVFPFHRCVCTAEVEGVLQETPLADFTMFPPQYHRGYGPRPYNPDSPRPPVDSLTIDGTRSELVVNGPGRFGLSAELENVAPKSRAFEASTCRVRVRLQAVDMEGELSFETALNYRLSAHDEKEYIAKWIFQPQVAADFVA